MKYRFSLEGVPKFEELLESTASDIRRSGKAHGFLSFAGDNQIHPFELQVSNFNVEDYGTGQGPECLVCDTRRDRRFGFFITCADGVERGPIGSGCIFEHVLGDEAGKRLGRQLNTIAADASYLQKHTRLIREAPNYPSYIEGLGLSWIFNNAELGRAKLTKHDYRKIGECKSSFTPFPKPILEKLKKHQLQPPPTVKSAAPMTAQPTVAQPTEKVLSEADRERMLTLWSHGLSGRFTAALCGRILDQIRNRFPISLTIHAQLKQFADEIEASLATRREAAKQRILREQEERERQEREWASQSQLREEKYTATDITAAACMHLNSSGAHSLRVLLMRHRTNWLTQNFPEDVLFYKVNGKFPHSFIGRLAKVLEPRHR